MFKKIQNLSGSMFLLIRFFCFHNYFRWEKYHGTLGAYINNNCEICYKKPFKMTSSSKQIRQKIQTNKKIVFLKEQAEYADSYESVMNKIMTTHKY